MLYKLLTLAILSLPAMASAQIYSSVSATSNSGGNTAGPGSSVVVGDSTASVQVSTTGSSSGTSSVYIKTDVNGSAHEEAATTVGAASVTLEATPQKTTIDIKEGTPPTTIKHVVVLAGQSQSKADVSTSATTSPAAATTSAEVHEEGAGLGTMIVLSIQNFFAGLLSWFK